MALCRGAASRDHPRVSGEHPRVFSVPVNAAGSSPRVRGTPFGSNGLSIDRGIIPACAGNTVRGWKFRRSKGDHPRVCGEHCVLIGNTDMASGSSPRVRGTPGRRLSSCRQRGIIPACAGNTVCCLRLGGLGWDHPRVCGEHHRILLTIQHPVGSSPRVRGTLDRISSSSVKMGIIPACAGNTSTCRETSQETRDHPRVCGEHATMQSLFLAMTGSSPRVRGTLLRTVWYLQPHGIIPACAGNTCMTSGLPRRSRDHPRVCGEHAAFAS